MNRIAEWLAAWASWLPNYPAFLAVLASIPLAVLARAGRVFPSRMLVVAALVPAVLTLALLLRDDLLSLVLALDASLAALAVLDLVTIAKYRDFQVTRDCQRIASLRKIHAVDIVVSNLSQRAWHVAVRDDLPQGFTTFPEQFELGMKPRSRATVTCELQPERRGSYLLRFVDLRVRSRLGFWNRFLRYPCESVVHVYPDLKQLSEYALLARTNRLNLMGVRRTRHIGQDNEFERLRDYTLDDNYKHIDWRSTARRNKLTVKDFQTNQSQRVVFLLDCGRMMTNEAGGLSLLDHSLNAMLMLSYVALARGDSVGLVTFSDQIHSSVPGRSGASQMNHLLHAVFDRFPRLVESRYEEAFLHVAARFRKRSLVVLITNLIDDVNAQQIHRYLSMYAGRHLPMAVLLRDHRVFDVADSGSEQNLYASAAAADILCWRQQVITDLQHRGVLVVDSFPESMTAPLINRYLEVKARHLL